VPCKTSAFTPLLSIGLNSPEKKKKKKSPEEGVTHISSLMHRVLETKTKNKKKEEKKTRRQFFARALLFPHRSINLFFCFWFGLFCFVLFCVPWIS
jgi:hypothetical protein